LAGLAYFELFQIAATNGTQELQASKSQNATLNKRRPIGFIQPKDLELTFPKYVPAFSWSYRKNFVSLQPL
jgi:hypothetical protein